jgi:hypothetical protein
LIEMLRGDLEAANIPELSRRVQGVLAQAELELRQLGEQRTIAVATEAAAALRDAAGTFRDEGSPWVAALREVDELAGSVREQLEAAMVADTVAGVRDAAGSVRELGDDLRGDLARLRTALAAIERLAAMLERDPGSLLHGRGSTSSPLQESNR